MSLPVSSRRCDTRSDRMEPDEQAALLDILTEELRDNTQPGDA